MVTARPLTILVMMEMKEGSGDSRAANDCGDEGLKEGSGNSQAANDCGDEGTSLVRLPHFIRQLPMALSCVRQAYPLSNHCPRQCMLSSGSDLPYRRTQ